MSEFSEIVRKFAHDVRNPLGGIKGLAELLQLKLPDCPEVEKKTTKIIGAANAIDELITEFLKQAQTLDPPSENKEKNSPSSANKTV